MFGYILLLAVFSGACCWIIIPLFKEARRQDAFRPQPVDLLEDLKNKKIGVYAVIKELEFDLKMGKLTEEDFQILKRQYIQEAVGYMREIDKLEASQAASFIAADKVSGKADASAGTGSGDPEFPERKYIYCTSCGQRHPIQSRFCAACGSKLHIHHGRNHQEEN